MNEDLKSPEPTSAESKAFDLGDVLTITTGRLVSERGVEAVYDILNFMTGDNLFTHQLPRAAEECAPHLIQQHPCLESPELSASLEELDAKLAVEDLPQRRMLICFKWVAELKAHYGETLMVAPIPPEAHTVRNPIEELVEMVGPERVLVVEVPEDTQP